MKVVYRAADGTEFGSADDCMMYEAKIDDGGIEMFDCNGNPTKDVNCAFLVSIPNKSNNDGTVIGAKWFIQKCEECATNSKADGIYTGIDKYSSGIFVWEEYDEEYRWLPENVVDILFKSFFQKGVKP